MIKILHLLLRVYFNVCYKWKWVRYTWQWTELKIVFILIQVFALMLSKMFGIKFDNAR